MISLMSFRAQREIPPSATGSGVRGFATLCLIRMVYRHALALGENLPADGIFAVVLEVGKPCEYLPHALK
jgi:hypothetical protein